MATGNDFIVGAMRKIEINAAESAIEAYETSDALEVLNDMLSELEPTLGLGFKRIAAASDTVRVPEKSYNTIKTNLAVHLLTEYGKPITPLLAGLATSTMENLIRTLVTIDVDLPNMLPQGSGNECDNLSVFFPTPEDDC